MLDKRGHSGILFRHTHTHRYKMSNTDGVKEASKRSSVSTLNNQLWTEGAGYDASGLSPTMQF